MYKKKCNLIVLSSCPLGISTKLVHRTIYDVYGKKKKKEKEIYIYIYMGEMLTSALRVLINNPF